MSWGKRASAIRPAPSPYPAPGRSAFFEAEPRLAGLHELVRRACSAGAPVPWEAVTALVDSFVGPDRDVRLRTLPRPHLEVAQRGLFSLDLRNAVLDELMSYDPVAEFVPRQPRAATKRLPDAGARVPSARPVQPQWVGG